MKLTKKIALASSSALSSLLLGAKMMVFAQGFDDIEVSPGTGYASDFGNMFSSILNVVMLIAAVLVFAYLIFGGIQWITSGGDKVKAEEARNKITAAIIGLIIVAASYAIINLIVNFLGFGSFNEVFQNVGTINDPKK
jgi:cytochrome bd-type quinol oxidase subunit 2